MDLRHIAVILDSGAKAAEQIQDAALHKTLSAMTETTVRLILGANNGGGFRPAIDEEFAELADRYR